MTSCRIFNNICYMMHETVKFFVAHDSKIIIYVDFLYIHFLDLVNITSNRNVTHNSVDCSFRNTLSPV